MPRRVLWACSKYAPWLGVLTCAHWEHHRVAVAAQWDLLQRRRSAVTAHRRRTWSRRERCSRRRRSHGVHGCADASLLRPHGVFTVLVQRLHWVLLFPLRSHRNCKELPRHWTIALPRRSNCVHRRLPLRRCGQTQQNCIKAASSLPPNCVFKLCRPHHGCWTPASRAIPCLFACPAGPEWCKRCAPHSETNA